MGTYVSRRLAGACRSTPTLKRMKSSLVRLCVVIALAPVATGLVAMVVHWALGCKGGVGPGVHHCKYASDGVGSALAGASWLVLGGLLSIPLALVVALLGRFTGRGKSSEGRNHAV